MRLRVLGLASAVVFVLTVWLANYAVQRWGVVSVGFGLVAPAGVYLAGLAFTLRDLTQRILGKPAVALAIVLGAALSWFVSPTLAVASAIAFLVSESADFVTYSVLERESFLSAVLFSNVVGVVLDSVIFLSIAFGSLAFLEGQIVGKAWMTLAALPVVLALRRVAPEATLKQ